MNSEIWKDIEDFPNYQVSNLGRVRNLKFKSPRYLSGHYDEDGYITVLLTNKTYRKHWRVHRLVGLYFCENLDPINNIVINHKNCIKDDNRAENLEWCTVKHNTLHAYENNLIPTLRGEEVYNHILTNDQVREIKRLLRDTNLKQTEIAKLFNTTHKHINKIKQGLIWRHIHV